jgi:predicted 2-oxoglutarate/Fe(II)-dependent dioxygenase YbiX
LAIKSAAILPATLTVIPHQNTFQKRQNLEQHQDKKTRGQETVQFWQQKDVSSKVQLKKGDRPH